MLRKFLKRKTTGITLIEMIIAIVIFSVVTLGTSTLFYYGNKQKVDSKIYYYAVGLAEDTIEKVRAMNDYTYSGVPAYTSATYNKYGITFSLERSAKDEYSYDGVHAVNRYKVISTTVTWQDRNGVTQSVDLHTIGHAWTF